MTHLEDLLSKPDDLKRVARYQRWVTACIFTQLVLALFWLVLIQLDSHVVQSARTLVLALVIPLGVAGGIYAFLVYWIIRNPFWAVIMGLASIPPVMGLLVLTVVNGTAREALKACGVTVGIFGANHRLIQNRSYLADEDLGW